MIGLSAAWRAARAGLSVTVVDPERRAGERRGWPPACWPPVTEAHYGEERLVTLLVAGAARWPAFAGELEAEVGGEIGYRRAAPSWWPSTRSDRAVVDDLLALQRRPRPRGHRLSGRGCRDLVPALAPTVRGGAEVPGDHQVDNRRLVAALVAAA